MKHNVTLVDKAVGEAILEITEDKMAEVILHCMGPRVTPEKPCVINLKIRMTPDEMKNKFDIDISASTSLSAQRSSKALIYSAVDDDGQISILEFNPKQTRMDFSKPPVG